MSNWEDAEEEFYGKTLIRHVNNWMGEPWFDDPTYVSDYPEDYDSFPYGEDNEEIDF